MTLPPVQAAQPVLGGDEASDLDPPDAPEDVEYLGALVSAIVNITQHVADSL